ncbi:hypothetical protein H4R26_005149, partial [Coemansia thaxteri]
TIQDGQGAPYFLDKINVRFMSDFNIERKTQLSGSGVDDLVQRIVATCADTSDPPFIGGAGLTLDSVATDDISSWAPWYTLFRQQWAGDMQPSEHELFMHPVACLLVASGSEADPIGALRALQALPAAQRALSSNSGGTKTLFYYLLVHDERDRAAVQTIDLQFDQVRKMFGQNSALLKVNTNTELDSESDSNDRSRISNIWSSNISATQQPLTAHPERSYGDMLTIRDVAALRDAVKLMMVRSVVPHMQHVVRLLSDQTASERRGITGRLFSAGRRYLHAGSKSDITFIEKDGDICYKHTSPEAMMRKLADYSFMLKDYRFAQSVYQIARRDFLSEKAWLCYAGAQEMVGVCKLMWEVQTAKAEFDSILEDVVSTYLHKTRTPRHYYAVRCLLVYYELLKHHRLYSFAPGVLLRVPSYSASLVAVFNEQAAYAFLKVSPRPDVRKFAFYAMLAAQSFQKASMGDLANRCLRMVRAALSCGPRVQEQARLSRDNEKDGVGAAAEDKDLGSAAAAEKTNAESGGSHSVGDVGITAKTNWSAIDLYINHELGRQSMAAHNYDEAFQYFMALMGDEKTPPKLQSKYLQELLQLFLESGDQSAVNQGSRHAGPIELSIPTIDPQLARVIMSPELEGEDLMLEWRLDGSNPSKAGAADSGVPPPRCCSVGEVVAVLLVVTNPLTIGVTLNNLTLECAFESSGETTIVSEPALDVSTVHTVILEGEQTTMATVQIVPRRAGFVSIVGVKYLLCDILPTFKSLVLPGKRMNGTLEQRVGVVHTPDTTLGFTVSPDLPRLHITVDDLPDTLMSGSMHRATLRVVNNGTLPCNSVVMWVSHPSFVGIMPPCKISCAEDTPNEDDSGKQQATTMYVPLPDLKQHERAKVPNVLRDCSTFVLVGGQPNAADAEVDIHHLKPLGSLGPGEAFAATVWIRGDRVGAHTLGLCIGANSVDTSLTARPSKSIKYADQGQQQQLSMRSRRFEVDLVVTPSLRVNAFVRSSAINPHERLLGVEIENMQSDLTVQLVQTTFSSGFYELVPLTTCNSSGSEPGKVLVGSRQAISLLYRTRAHGHVSKSKLDTPDLGAMPEMFAVQAMRQFIYSNEKPSLVPGPIRLIYSNDVFADQGIDRAHSSLQSYILRSQAHRRRNILRTSYPLIPDKHHAAIFPLFETFGIDFVLFWREVGGAGRAGHHSISGIDLGVPHDYLVESLNPPSEGAARAWLSDTVHDREALIQSIASRPEMAARSERPLDVLIQVAKPSLEPLEVSDAEDMVGPVLLVTDVDIS